LSQLKRNGGREEFVYAALSVADQQSDDCGDELAAKLSAPVVISALFVARGELHSG
jgi:hypothetical protein